MHSITFLQKSVELVKKKSGIYIKKQGVPRGLLVIGLYYELAALSELEVLKDDVLEVFA